LKALQVWTGLQVVVAEVPLVQVLLDLLPQLQLCLLLQLLPLTQGCAELGVAQMQGSHGERACRGCVASGLQCM
jgi:hypothetical protein